ncbi:MAG: Sensor histidine kinase YycG [Parcubacteria group bacterium ADurb.Bin316]|nr:MAG: Sensor histidine kinase YycG [Parcubacteria group bacterium ADurb.Bin316]HOZ56169.1 ATP-binding protein [bacterium]
MNSRIFRKLFSALITIGIVPMIIFSFLTVSSYQELINTSISNNLLNPALVSDAQLNFENIRMQTILIFVLMAIFVIFFSIILTRNFIFPIKKLIKGTEELRRGNLGVKIDLKTNDEFQVLANSFNQMAQDLNQKVNDLQRSEKATLQAFADLTSVENNLEAEHHKTAAIISNFIDPIIVIDKDNKLSFLNPAAKEIFGFIDSDLGRIVDSANNYSMENFRKFINTKYLVKSGAAIKSNNPDEEEVVINYEDQELTYKVITAKVMAEKNEYLGVMKIFYNLTREKTIDRMKSEFISIAAHQLRTPLSAIKWVIKMILDGDAGKLNEEQQGLLAQGYASNERIITLVNDMLNVSRIEEGRFGYSFSKDRLDETLNIVVKSLENQINSKKIKLVLDVPAKLSKVFMDKQKMTLVLQNLLENAVKYTPEYGKIEIKVKDHKKDLKISIKDNGIGIPKKDQEKLFSKFFRAENVVRMQTEGSGLGLFIVKNIIEKHGGEIECKSEEGKGTEFIFNIPIDSVGNSVTTKP